LYILNKIGKNTGRWCKKQAGLTNKKLAVIIRPSRKRNSSGFEAIKEWKKMQERKIKLNATEDVQEFVNSASQCEFDVDVFYNRVLIDAKSILGVLSMDLNHVLTVKYCGENRDFERILTKYAAA